MLLKHKQTFYSSNLERYIDNIRDNNLSDISWIFCVFAEDSPKHKLLAAQVLTKTLKTLSFEDICSLDLQMRQTTSMEWSINWKDLNIKSFMTGKMSEEEKRTIVIFSSFNPNGYIRQQAVELLSTYEGTMPFIVLRQNDWVANVRQTASLSFSIRLKTAAEKEILDSLPFLEKLRRSKRCDCTSILDLFYQELQTRNSTHMFKIGLSSQEIVIRRFCIDTLMHAPTSAPTCLREHIEKEKDPFLRKLIFQWLINKDIHIDNLYELFLKDKFPSNRVLALQYLYEHNPDNASKKAEIFLLDKNPTARMFARNILGEMNMDINFHQFYLSHLMSNTSCAILGLGETGSSKDCESIEKYLNSSKTSVKRASMISLMRLDAERYHTVITEMLLSEQIGIVKTAKLLIEKYNTFRFDRIFEIYRIAACENTKIKCAALLFSSSKWPRLIYVLLLLDSHYESIQTLCSQELDRWISAYNRSYSAASTAQIKTISELINLQEMLIPEKTRKQLNFLIR